MRLGLMAFGLALAVAPAFGAGSPALPGPAAPRPQHVRVLPLEGGINFRDLGGYATRDGRHVRWQMLYRSGNMAGLTPADYAYLDRLGIVSVCDLRSVAEQKSAPVNWGGAHKPDYWTSDIADAGGDLRRIFAAHPTPDKVRDAMIDLYRTLPIVQRDGYRHIFAELVAGRVPLAFNCSAGKDRSGVAAALILSALGVPRATVVEDYTLTDKVGDLTHKLTGPGKVLGGAPSPLMAPVLRADPAYINAMFDELDHRYGGIEGYLRKELGIGPAELRRMRARLLR